jgi:sulfide:quinone oxidoreductase
VRTLARPKVLVLGGGFGGLESALYMRSRMPDQAQITLISDKDYFLFKPNTIYVPFGLDPKKLRLRLAGPTRRKDIHFVQSHVREIDPISQKVHMDGGELPYDYLVVATGAGMRLEAVPGLSEFGNVTWTTEQMLDLRATLHQVFSDARDGKSRSVLFLVPPGNRYSGPLYEMIMMLDTWLQRKKVREQVELLWATHEDRYIQAFGPGLHDLVAQEFERRNIKGFTGHVARHVEPNEVVFQHGERLPFDVLIAFPPYAASLSFGSLPIDEQGFIATDLASRQVKGYPEVFAVGDTSDFPVKQAFLAFLQADTAADQISSAVLGRVPLLRFDPAGMGVVDGLDRATFDQVPMNLATGPDLPFETATAGSGAADPNSLASAMYRVSASPIWRLGKMALGIYLPWRFKAGNPFHTGLPWKGMDSSVRPAAGVPAR